MGLLDTIKGKFKKNEPTNINDIRTHIIGEETQNQPDPLGAPPQPVPLGPQQAAPEEQPFDPRNPEPMKFEDDLPPSFDKNIVPPNEPIQQDRNNSRDYEVRDKLNIIESQLSAIRSQTETINERLKNIEMKLGRKY